MEESQDISRHSRDMPVKPPRPEGDSQTTYIPTDFFPIYKYFVPGWIRTRTEEICTSVVKYSASTDRAIPAQATRISTIFSICKMPKSGTAELMKCAFKIYFRTRRMRYTS